jgi:hypothetical protein
VLLTSWSVLFTIHHWNPNNTTCRPTCFTLYLVCAHYRNLTRNSSYTVLIKQVEISSGSYCGYQDHIVTCIPIARQRFGKHLPAGANVLNDGTFIARQRISKHTSLTIEAVSSVGSVPRGYKRTKKFAWAVKWRVEFREANLLGYELGCRGIELSRVRCQDTTSADSES